jgi:hypothetical protein
MDLYSLTPHYFEWAVQRMADMAIRFAREPRRPLDAARAEFLLGRRDSGDGSAYVETPRSVSVESDVTVPPAPLADLEARL